MKRENPATPRTLSVRHHHQEPLQFMTTRSGSTTRPRPTVDEKDLATAILLSKITSGMSAVAEVNAEALKNWRGGLSQEEIQSKIQDMPLALRDQQQE